MFKQSGTCFSFVFFFNKIYNVGTCFLFFVFYTLRSFHKSPATPRDRAALVVTCLVHQYKPVSIFMLFAVSTVRSAVFVPGSEPSFPDFPSPRLHVIHCRPPFSQPVQTAGNKQRIDNEVASVENLA